MIPKENKRCAAFQPGTAHAARALTSPPTRPCGNRNLTQPERRVHPEFVDTNVGPLPSAGVASPPPEGRRPTHMTNSRCTPSGRAWSAKVDKERSARRCREDFSFKIQVVEEGTIAVGGGDQPAASWDRGWPRPPDPTSSTSPLPYPPKLRPRLPSASPTRDDLNPEAEIFQLPRPAPYPRASSPRASPSAAASAIARRPSPRHQPESRCTAARRCT